MTEQLNKILEELYVLDPKLKTKEKELVKIIEKLLSTKPEVRIDETFVANLRRELLNREIKVRPSVTSFVSFLRKKPVYITGSIIAVLILVISFGYLNFTNENNLVFEDFGEENIVSTKSGSFGSLAGVFQFGGQGDMLESAPQNLSAGAGGGGGTFAAPVASESIMVGDRATGMIAPSYKQYVFKYTGGDFEIDATEMAVFKRAKGYSASTGLVSTVVNQVKSMIDLSSLSNMKVNAIRMTQDTSSGGYDISLSLLEGAVNIDRNVVAYGVAEASVYKEIPAKDMPKDAEIISIANNFLKKFGINRGNYGEPYVDNSWEERAVFYGETGAEARYISPVISVVYPITIEGNEVYDQGGSRRGLQVNVNINEKYVQNAWNLTTEKYESSNYAITDDYEKITKFAEQGGAYPNYYGDNAELVTLNLGQPELIYVLQYKYNGYESSSDELYIPAFRFPILNAPSEYYGRKAIIIPIVKEILDEYGNVDDIVPRPMIEPMPMEDAIMGDDEAAMDIKAEEVR